MNELRLVAQKSRSKQNHSTPYEQFLEMAREACHDSTVRGVPQYSKVWLLENTDLILAAFSYGFSAKTVCAIFGIPWETWSGWIIEHPEFNQLNSHGESMQLMHFEQIRNEIARGERRGSATAALHGIDRLHSDVYFGKPGMHEHDSNEDEMSFTQALAILDQAGIDIEDI